MNSGHRHTSVILTKSHYIPTMVTHICQVSRFYLWDFPDFQHFSRLTYMTLNHRISPLDCCVVRVRVSCSHSVAHVYVAVLDYWCQRCFNTQHHWTTSYLKTSRGKPDLFTKCHTNVTICVDVIDPFCLCVGSGAGLRIFTDFSHVNLTGMDTLSIKCLNNICSNGRRLSIFINMQ